MILFFQIPIADFRFVSLVETSKLPKPFWPTPSPKEDFLRNFGEVRRRRKGGVEGWVGENEFCEAKHAVKLSMFSPFKVDENNKISLKVSGRHFYADGDALAKFEMVLLTKPKIISITNKQFCNFFYYFFNIPVLVSQIPPLSKPIPLARIGKNLVQLYLLSSSVKQKSQSVDSKWMNYGNPIVVIESGANEKIFPIRDAICVDVPNYPIQIFHWWQKNGKEEISSWVIKRNSNDKEAKNESRLIRIILMRLHAEHQVLELVLKAVITKQIKFTSEQVQDRKNNPQLQAFQAYLNHATHTILGLNRDAENYFEPDQIGDLVRKSFEKITPGKRHALRKQLEKLQMRPQVTEQVNNYIDQIYIGEFHGQIQQIQEQIMGDKNVNYGQIGVMGSNAHLENVDITQISDGINDKDIKKLSRELNLLKREMEKVATEPEHKLAIGAIAAAEQSAKKNDKEKTMFFLKSAGKWALDIATKISVDVAIGAIKASMGLP